MASTDGIGDGFATRFLVCNRDDFFYERTLGNSGFFDEITTLSGIAPFTLTASELLNGPVVITSSGQVNLPSTQDILMALRSFLGESHRDISAVLRDGMIVEITNNGAGMVTLSAQTGTTFEPNGDSTFEFRPGETARLRIMPVNSDINNPPLRVDIQPIYGGTPVPPIRDQILKYFIPPQDEISTFTQSVAWAPGIDTESVPYIQLSNNNAAQCTIEMRLPLRGLWESLQPFAFSLEAVNVYVAPFAKDLVMGNPVIQVLQIPYVTANGSNTGVNAIPGNVSGILTSVGATPVNAGPNKFRVHSFVPTTLPHWLSNGGNGQQINNDYELRLQYVLDTNVGSIPGIRFYGAHVTVRYVW